ncbi:gas vesicle protein GvpJ [Micromonospora maritima]|uniref:gas vesicle protein GvpJ n=1 Tax=Micromonospora maritima TaxID=986711 RepID=UPI00157D50B3|nr:gas vesicle protein GvpJ [Micromonospora maritima]
MSVAATTGSPGSALERTGGGGSGLSDVVETVLDKGVVIDAQVSVAVVGIQLLEINARVVVASIETYLRFADTVDRMDIVPKDQKTLPDLVDGVAGAAAKGRAVSGLGKAAQEISGAVADSIRGGDDGERRRRRSRER